MSSPPAQVPNSPPRKSSTPSLFNNEYSRGPLYQAWRERHRESVETRERRVSDAKERARGQKPRSPESGPSSRSEYQNRLERNLSIPPTPAYEPMDRYPTLGTVSGVVSDDLPAYEDFNAHLAEQAPSAAEQGEFAQSSRDEKERLQRHFVEESAGEEGRYVGQPISPGEEPVVGKGKEKERKKSIGKSIGNWVGVAFTGYGLKSDGKRNENRW